MCISGKTQNEYSPQAWLFVPSLSASPSFNFYFFLPFSIGVVEEIELEGQPQAKVQERHYEDYDDAAQDFLALCQVVLHKWREEVHGQKDDWVQSGCHNQCPPQPLVRYYTNHLCREI